MSTQLGCLTLVNGDLLHTGSGMWAPKRLPLLGIKVALEVSLDSAALHRDISSALNYGDTYAYSSQSVRSPAQGNLFKLQDLIHCLTLDSEQKLLQKERLGALWGLWRSGEAKSWLHCLGSSMYKTPSWATYLKEKPCTAPWEYGINMSSTVKKEKMYFMPKGGMLPPNLPPQSPLLRFI